MSLSDSIVQSSFSPQEAVYGDPVFFRADDGEYSIEAKGIFKSQFILVDSMTQQEVLSDSPAIWIRRPTPIPMVQNLKLRHLDNYYQISEVRNDTDENAYNLVLHKIRPPDAN